MAAAMSAAKSNKGDIDFADIIGYLANIDDGIPRAIWVPREPNEPGRAPSERW
jgi:hypothetical protein